MTNPFEANDFKKIHEVNIGRVEGDLHGVTIAGRDVKELAIETLKVNIFEDDDAAREYNERNDILDLMQKVWITNTLEPLLQEASFPEALFELRPDAVEHPWANIVNISDQKRRLLPAGTSLADIFDEMEGSLLLLSEPDVTRTILLLDLVQQALGWAEDPEQPLPVVIPLGWWTNTKQPFAEWLVDILGEKYAIRKTIANEWLDNGLLMLFLDGLEQIEVDKQRAICIVAINDFYQEYGLTQMIVCCQPTTYETVKMQLQLQAAVALK